LGNIFVFSKENFEFEVYNTEEAGFGSASCIDLIENYMVVGSENG